jgi:hypothetical protein
MPGRDPVLKATGIAAVILGLLFGVWVATVGAAQTG